MGFAQAARLRRRASQAAPTPPTIRPNVPGSGAPGPETSVKVTCSAVPDGVWLGRHPSKQFPVKSKTGSPALVCHCSHHGPKSDEESSVTNAGPSRPLSIPVSAPPWISRDTVVWYVPVVVVVCGGTAAFVSSNSHVPCGSVNERTKWWVPPPPPRDVPVTSPDKSKSALSKVRPERSSVRNGLTGIEDETIVKSETPNRPPPRSAPMVTLTLKVAPGTVPLVSVNTTGN